MTPELYQYYKFKLKAPDLTFNQATLIEELQDSLSSHSTEHSFSTWEELDYELTMMSEILTPGQFAHFQKRHEEQVKKEEQELISKDIEKIHEITIVEEHIRYIQEEVLPELLSDSFLLFLEWRSADISKINFLKSEYKVFLKEQKVKTLSQHFRHKRKFQPNQLKISLLQHKIMHLIPNYGLFSESMDKPTKVVADHVVSKLNDFPEATETLMTTKFTNLGEFTKANYEKQFKENSGIWHISTPKPITLEEREELFMTMLLLDKEGYAS